MKIPLNPQPLAHLLSLVVSHCGGIRAALAIYLQNDIRRRCGLNVGDKVAPTGGKAVPVCGLTQIHLAEGLAQSEAEDFASRYAAESGKEKRSAEINRGKPGDIDPLSLLFQFHALSSQADQEILQLWIGSRTMIEILALRSMLEIHAEVFGDMIRGAITIAEREMIPGLPESLQ